MWDIYESIYMDEIYHYPEERIYLKEWVHVSVPAGSTLDNGLVSTCMPISGWHGALGQCRLSGLWRRRGEHFNMDP